MAALKCILSSFEYVGNDLTNYLDNDNERDATILSLLQQVFKYNKKDESNSGRNVEGCPLAELETEGFDHEQLWQQIQLQNESLLTHSSKKLKHLLKEKPMLWLNGRSGVEIHDNVDGEVSDNDINDDIDDNGDDIDDNGDDFSAAADDDIKEDSENDHQDKVKRGNSIKQSSVVDDQFFKLSEMEKFLEMEEQDKKDNDDDDDVDLFMDYNKGGEDDNIQVKKAKLSTRKNNSKIKDPGSYMYADFFDVPDGVSLRNTDKNDKKMAQEEIDGGEVEMDHDDSVNDDNYECSESEIAVEDNNVNKSTFERQQDKVKKKIEQLENSNVTAKPWQLVGEASASYRPPNSLLEEMLYFDHTTAAAPVVTEETSLQLEDIIQQRIKDQTWDDVERKTKPMKEPYTYKKNPPLNQEKSKMSLSEIYEKEYLAHKEPVVDKNNEKHEEIKKMMTALFSKLDALSNFHFTPKPFKPEVNIIANVGSVAMEESIPVTVSDTNLLAPEEIFDKQKKEVKGATEQTKEDRKHERRLKKKRQHLAAKGKKKTENLGNKYTKEKIKKLKKENLNSEGNEDKKSFTSSSAFFAKLQDSILNEIQEKKSVSKKKKNHLQSAEVRL